MKIRRRLDKTALSRRILNWSGGTIYGSKKWSGTNYGCHKRSHTAITGPGRTIRGNKIIVKKGSGTIFGCRLILRSRNVLAIYELPSSNEDQMEFRYKHWCGRAERRARRLAGATVVGPVTARADQLWHAETGPPDQIWRRTNYCVTAEPHHFYSLPPLRRWCTVVCMYNSEQRSPFRSTKPLLSTYIQILR